MSDRTSRKNLTNMISTPPVSIPLEDATEVDLSWLSDEERRAIVKDYVRERLDISARARERELDLQDLHDRLGVGSRVSGATSNSGTGFEFSLRQDTSFGETTVVLRNRDWTPYYVLGALAAAVLIVISVAG